MLNNVPTQVNRSTRLVTLRHPNAMDCAVFKKVVNRLPDTAPPDDEMGGLPTIGGLGVLNSDDEADFTYELRGEAKVLFTGIFQYEQGNTLDDDTGLNYREPSEACIECLVDPSDPDYFIADKNDLVTVMPGAGIVMTYEVVAVSGNIQIPPYVRKYALEARQDQNVGI